MLPALVVVALWFMLFLERGMSATTEEARAPSHIVFLLIDDFGFGDASYKGAMYKQTAQRTY